ncbi:peptide chain release factor N(5)-glutamine methyltransferase [Inhella proteolytica]|uniref:Release factor glutamine methyltransferase n=1 Tax=Inhella proteolytica TaxID=2795029 RepID=A0A931NCV1_9BURK|nr:peptide chain release factor N(5)-glutamine methyltransferase [Inhella proteolytica]MBH9575972.1 peptide chain release factor N(5)-glutamine methyltransferase [Inhella proteolytica]
MTIQEALQQAARLGIARLDAQLLLAHLLDRPREWLIAHDTEALPSELARQYLALLQQRADEVPLAYLTGQKEFHGLELNVNRATLVPRPDTETLVDWALELLPTEAPCTVLDLGTGSGCIALALKAARPQAQVSAVDRSTAALAQARTNGERLGLAVAWHEGSWFAPLVGQRFDLIVSNPPYIPADDPHLAALRHEPISALAAGADGLDDLRWICAQAPQHLNPGGWLLLEHGFDQADAVADLLRQAGFAPAQHRLDLAGHRRCTGARISLGA